jgi:gliding motility-associated-like protein
MKKLLLVLSLLHFTIGYNQPISVNTSTYTVPQLVNDVLINTPCSSATNITWKTGSQFSSVNGIGYFQNTNPNFPMRSGVILSTGNVLNAVGPNNSILNDGSMNWPGDSSLEQTLAQAGIHMNSINASVLEFDFTPISPNFSFDFIFASEEYGNFQCRYSDGFAFLLTNLNTGETRNLAVVPGTNDPISVATIRNFLYNSSCPSENEDYFGRFNGGSNASSSAINFNGQTKVMRAEATLITGTPYHIKLVIADRLDFQSDSAIFLSSNSFNIGQDVLTEDLTVANGTSLCTGSTYTIETNLDPTVYTFVWKKDSVIITGENGPNLTINSPGTYSVTYQNSLGACSAVTNSMVIEYSSQISATNPRNLYRCNSSTNSSLFNLDTNTSTLLTGLDVNTTVTYHISQIDALNNANALPLQYTVSQNTTTIYAKVVVPSGCYVIKSFQLILTNPAVANPVPDQIKCETTFGTNKAIFNLNSLKNTVLGSQSSSTYTITYHITESDAITNNNPISNSQFLLNVNSFNTSSTTVYVRVQNTSDPECFSTTSINLIVNPLPIVDELESVEVCTNFVLPSLINGRYFTQPNANGDELFAGDIIDETKTIYIFNQPDGVGTCSAMSSFTVNVIELDSISFEDEIKCGSYRLPTLPQGNFYTESGGNGTIIPFNTVINTSQTIYYYYKPETLEGDCEVDTSFSVTIYPNVTLIPRTDVFECTSYTLPELTIGKYYYLANGNGDEIHAGTQITTNRRIYIYATTGGDFPCTAQVSFNVFIGIETPADIDQCHGYTLPALPIGKYFTGPAGTGTVIPAGTIINTNSTIYIYQPTTSGTNNCTDNLSFNLQFSAPEIDTFQNQSSCVNYTLPELQNGDYFTGPNGTGTMLSAGHVITSSQTLYIFKRVSAGCFSESSFTIYIISLPSIESRADIDICDQYVLTPLEKGHYYTEPNGLGTQLNGGDVVSSSQRLYIYYKLPYFPFCSNENSFQINVFSTVADAPDNVTTCDSYTLPVLSPDNHYYTQTGGPNGSGIELLPGTVITSSQTIYVFREALIRSDFTCSAENPFTVTINHTPVINPIANVKICDEYVLPNLSVGNYFTQPNGTGTMIEQSTSLISSQTLYVYAETATNPNCTAQETYNVEIYRVDRKPNVITCDNYILPTLHFGKYYTQPNGAGNQLMPGQVITTSQTVYIFGNSTFSPVCSSESTFTITIVETPVAYPTTIDSRTVCDEDDINDGITNFDLTSLNSQVLGSQTTSEFVVEYFESENDAINSVNPVSETTLKNVYVKVTNTLAPDCYDIKSITIIVNKLPEPNPIDGFVCIDSATGNLLKSYTMYSGLSASTHTFEWRNENDEIVATTTAYTTNESGTFTLIATNNVTGCSSKLKEVIVNVSEPAKVEYTVEDNFSDNQNIIVKATGNGGDYEYAIDGSVFQDSNVFENVTSGIHSIIIRDKNGCDVTTIQALVINYPKFFTPNGDGYNDTWNIKDLKNQTSAIITIFDRYGKALTQIKPSSAGWDGTYNGKTMISDDYWFTITYTNENNEIKEFKSHFSLKR